MSISSAELRDEMRTELKESRAKVIELEATIRSLRREVSRLDALLDEYNYPRQ